MTEKDVEILERKDRKNFVLGAIMIPVSFMILGIIAYLVLVFEGDVKLKLLYITFTVVLLIMSGVILQKIFKISAQNEKKILIYRINEHMASLGYTKEEIEERQAFLSVQYIDKLRSIQRQFIKKEKEQLQQNGMSEKELFEPSNRK
ncbi:hypothetical protein NSA29_12215 [Staphylococcus warneri]|uniref:hypothetical protein n=1 Tax=Staphylococcus warneri TaxID=1292 RepID=UPI00214BC633|nr:hypothetical protein [Staphylococcus warneri]MCR1798300.1 hypothetical protein [Staphylococcus warneri]